MDDLDKQTAYWDSVAAIKTFSHPIQEEFFQKLVPLDSNILDYGCGYGRTCINLMNLGYKNVIGVDISLKMIKRGLSLYEKLKLVHIEEDKLLFDDQTFSVCTLFAVLTCVPTNSGQQKIIDDIYRVLKQDGLIYISDFPLQPDERNIKRYNQFQGKYDSYGTFRLPDGGVVRHHSMEWIYQLLSSFKIIDERRLKILTMNGNEAECFQIIAEKKKK